VAHNPVHLAHPVSTLPLPLGGQIQSNPVKPSKEFFENRETPEIREKSMPIRLNDKTFFGFVGSNLIKSAELTRRRKGAKTQRKFFLCASAPLR
jgi:hypothetical protein